GTGNPNDRLKSITVNGTELINFDAEDLSSTYYSIDVPCDTETATVNAQTVASTTATSYNKTTALSSGKTTTISIQTQAQNGTTRDYTVDVTAADHNFVLTEIDGEQVNKCSRCGKLQAPDIDGSGNPNDLPIKDVQISNVTSDGYRVTVKLANANAATEIKFPTWTEKNGQDDIIWYSKNVTSDTVVYDIKTKDHNNETGKYYTHVYIYNGADQIGLYGQEINVPAKSNPAMIQTVNFSNITSDGYTINVQLKNSSSAQKIQFPTWSEKNGQD